MPTAHRHFSSHFDSCSNFVLAQLKVLGLLYWPSASPRANTAHLGPVTVPIRNYLINNIIIQLLTLNNEVDIRIYLPSKVIFTEAEVNIT